MPRHDLAAELTSWKLEYNPKCDNSVAKIQYYQYNISSFPVTFLSPDVYSLVTETWSGLIHTLTLPAAGDEWES